MDVPEDAPDACPVCEAAYDSVSRHDGGLMVNLLDNARYRRVCFEPVDDEGGARVRFYHHTHEQAGTDGAGGGDTPGRTPGADRRDATDGDPAVRGGSPSR
jgi:hypothetical protein